MNKEDILNAAVILCYK